MSKRQWICLIGVWIIIFLFLGMPSGIDKICAIVTGVILIGIGYNMPEERRESIQKNSVFTETSHNDQHISQ